MDGHSNFMSIVLKDLNTVNKKVEREKSFAAYWISSKCRENFHSFCFICIESAAIAKSICRENFRDSSKICKNAKFFSHVAFVAFKLQNCSFSGFKEFYKINGVFP